MCQQSLKPSYDEPSLFPPPPLALGSTVSPVVVVVGIYRMLAEREKENRHGGGGGGGGIAAAQQCVRSPPHPHQRKEGEGFAETADYVVAKQRNIIIVKIFSNTNMTRETNARKRLLLLLRRYS